MSYKKFDPVGFDPRPPIQPDVGGDISNISDFSGETEAETEYVLHCALLALRPFLPQSLASLPDDNLFFLVAHAIRHGRDLTRGHYSRYCPSCGLPLSAIAVSKRCGACLSESNE
jgi:hypothetical protein